MKGLELPINALVIIVIVLVVLLAIIAMFFGGINPASSSTTLQSATTSTCLRVNPLFCKSTDSKHMRAARTPVNDFDANNDGTLNTHVPDGEWATSFGNDNLEMLCIKYYNCQNAGLTDASWAAWYRCCLKKVCGCP